MTATGSRTPIVHDVGAAPIIWLDLDGTLVDGTGAPYPGLERVSGLKSAGYELAIASARAPRDIRAIARRLGGLRCISAFQGAAILSATAGKGTLLTPLAPQAVRTIVRHCTATSQNAWLYSMRKWWALTLDSAVRREEKIVGRSSDGTLGHLRKVPLYKLVIVSEDDCESDVALDTLIAGLPVRAIHSHPTYLEIVSAETCADKGVGVATRELGYASYVAVGDGQNDVGMLARAALSFSFENAHPDAQRAAQIVLPPPAEGGLRRLAEYLEG